MLADTAAEVSFGEDGSINGTGGCNRLMGNYTVEGGTMTLEPLATTRMACPEPEGVMDQETKLLAALESATGYAIDGDTLRLTNAEDATAVTLSRR